MNLRIPPLRERPQDVLALAEHFVEKYSKANGLPGRAALGRRPQGAARSTAGRGNVRELENTLHRAVLLTSGAEIGADALMTPDGMRLDAAPQAPRQSRMRRSPPSRSTRALVGRTVADVERDLILETLKHCLGNRTHAANILGISIRTLRNKLNEYAGDGVPVPPPHGGEMRMAG